MSTRFTLLLAACLLAAPAAAQDRAQEPLLQRFALFANAAADDDDAGDEEEGKFEFKVQVSVSPYWIGAVVTPVGEALQSHLGLKHGLQVMSVVDDGPAAGQLQPHDIITHFNDKRMSTMEDLLQAVGKAKQAKSSLRVIRKGKKQAVELTPAKRPADQMADATQPFGLMGADKEINVWIEKMLADKDGPAGLQRRLVLVGPGVTEAPPQFKGAFRVEVKSDGNGPAQYTITHDGKQYKVTEDKLDKLPAKVRMHVRGLGKPGAAGGPPIAIAPRIFRWNEIGKLPGQQRVEVRRIEKQGDDETMKKILRQLEKLGEEIQELKKMVKK